MQIRAHHSEDGLGKNSADDLLDARHPADARLSCEHRERCRRRLQEDLPDRLLRRVLPQKRTSETEREGKRREGETKRGEGFSFLFQIYKTMN